MPDIAIWNRCNNHCIMCTNYHSFQEESTLPYSFENIFERWGNLPLKQTEVLSLTGGEPTIHPDFFKIIKRFTKLYPNNKIAIATNGRLFAYSQFTKKLLKYRNLILEIAIHDYNAKNHDAITRTKGSFNNTIKGLHNILKYKNDTHEIEIRIVLTKLNYKHLDKIIQFIRKEFSINQIRDIAIIFEELEGQARDNIKEVGIRYRDIKPIILPIINKYKNTIPEIRLYHFPLCVIPKELWLFTWRTLRSNEVTFLTQCHQCAVKKYCLGIHKDYLEVFGDAEFHALKNIKIKTTKNWHKPIFKLLH